VAQWLTLAILILSVVIVPVLVTMLRMSIRWTRVEAKLEQLVLDVKKLVVDKDRTHQELQQQATNDRQATDKRLRWLEEFLWKRGSQS